jgi:hypothetical protein
LNSIFAENIVSWVYDFDHLRKDRLHGQVSQLTNEEQHHEEMQRVVLMHSMCHVLFRTDVDDHYLQLTT